MSTLQIVGNSSEAIKFFGHTRSMPVVNHKNTKTNKQDIQPMTMEELRARIEKAEQAISSGNVTSQEILEKEMLSW
jgi:hypothetical protein